MKISGDIPGLGILSSALSKVPAQLTDSADHLSKQVERLVHDAGWNGSAADSFEGAWERDAIALVQLASIVKIAASTLGTLADKLSQAQYQLDSAIGVAQRAGVSFNGQGPLPGPYVGTAAQAAQEFGMHNQAIQKSAHDARLVAQQELYALLSALDPNLSADATVLSAVDATGLAGILKGYYLLPQGISEDFEHKLQQTQKDYESSSAARQALPKDEYAARALLNQEMHELKPEIEKWATRLSKVSGIADHFKGGKMLSYSLGDITKAYGLGEDLGKISRFLDGIPLLDLSLTAAATSGQMKEDEEKGWTRQHALLADGGANLAGMVAGLATDAIPGFGIFLSPITGYGVGGIVNEATHAGHWGEHINEDGVVKGVAEGIGDTASAFWKNDVVGMEDKVTEAITHPVDTVKSIWKGLFS
jgi:uncharacterized protein YukE